MPSDASAAQPNAPLHVHVQISAGSLDIFRITEARFQDGLAVHDGLHDRIAVSFGEDDAALELGLRTAQVLLAGNFRSDDLERRAPRLRWVQTIFAGVEKLAGAIPPGITLTNASGVHAPKAAEFTMTAIGMLNSHLPRLIANQRERRWEPIFTTALAGKTVVIAGVGSLGQAIAEQARRSGLRAIGVGRTAREVPGFGRCHTPADFSRILPGADFLVVTLPNAPQARGLIDRAALDLLPRTAGVVSIGRAQAMDYGALMEKLARDELSGAVIDVFEQEPLPPDSPVWSVPNLIITPHCAVDDAAAYVPRSLDVFFDNLGRYLDGRPLRNVVDPALGY